MSGSANKNLGALVVASTSGSSGRNACEGARPEAIAKDTAHYDRMLVR